MGGCCEDVEQNAFVLVDVRWGEVEQPDRDASGAVGDPIVKNDGGSGGAEVSGSMRSSAANCSCLVEGWGGRGTEGRVKGEGWGVVGAGCRGRGSGWWGRGVETDPANSSSNSTNSHHPLRVVLSVYGFGGDEPRAPLNSTTTR